MIFINRIVSASSPAMKKQSALIISLLAALFFMLDPALAELKIDGRLEESDWENAQSFRDFVVISPLTYGTPKFPTEARILSTPEGIAVAFICDQPSGESRTRTITQRDAMKFDSDSVTLMIDFEGSGKIAYEFSVSISGSYRDGTTTGEMSANYDWDGLWEHAANEEPDRWTVEMLLPWSIAVTREGEGENRQLGVSFQRVLHSGNETFAFPAASPERARYISEFTKIEIPGYSSQEFNVWPYVTVLSDLVKNTIEVKTGIDVFWKPSNRLQVAATVNPDFGQVESDDLVIDFSATEVFFGDKRPFFTENQGIFQLTTPVRNNIFYTRRVGGPSDDGGQASNIDAAVKIIGSDGRFDYGIFAAKEADDAGRSFFAGRLTFPSETWSLGAMSTYVDRPFLDRTALVNVIDYDVRLGDSVRWQGKFLSSHIGSPMEDEAGYGFYSNFVFNPSERWNYEVTLTRYSETLDINDMGYMLRNDLEEAFMSVDWVHTDLPDDSRYASVSWNLKSVLSRNTEGDALPAEVSLRRNMKLTSGSDIMAEVELKTKGYDDLISRGNGLVRLNERWNTEISYTTSRSGSWSKEIEFAAFQEGYEDWSAGIAAGATWYCRDNLNIDFTLNPTWSRDWLIWQQDDRFAGFSKRQVTGGIGTSWFPAEKHEVRLRTQWYVIDAEGEQGYRIGSGGRLVASNDPVNGFAVINFGLQLRYRYEIAPLSDLYIVYSRGGLERIDDPNQGMMGLLADSAGLRNSDQFLVKLRYRF